MSYQPFLIANMRVAKETDLQPWLLPDDAFPELFNAYQYRGVIRKRGGNTLLGRLGDRTLALANRSGSPQTYAGTLGAISPSSLIITDGVTTFEDNGFGVMAVVSGSGNPGTINYTTGAYSVIFTAANGTAAVSANYIIAVNDNSPVMGLCLREILQLNDNALLAFDMTQAYQFNNTADAFQNISTYKLAATQTTTNPVVWTGTNYQFFDSTNMQNAFFATNDVPGQNFYAITAISKAVNAAITTAAANNFAIGDVVYINNVTVPGMSQINNLPGKVTAAGNPFTVNIDSSGFTAYTSGGVVWAQTLSATNANSGDGIKWYDGTGWVNFQPPLDGTPTPVILQGALLLANYKGRMVALNTLEGVAGSAPSSFPNRARFSQNISTFGSIYYAPPLPANAAFSVSSNAWYTANGLGGAIDAPTAEEIVGAEFIKDTLIVYFERSTYRLQSPGNGIAPFKWEKINTELGAESTFSTIPFDKAIYSVGSNGIYECDSINIQRIDQKIPDEVFDFGNENQGIARVQGVRDYYTQYAYWTYVDPSDNADGDDASSDPVFPNRILAFNYIDAAWATFQNYYTCFGHYQTNGSSTWGNTNLTWNDMTTSWNSAPLQTQFPIIVAGNQQGFVFMPNLVSADDGFPISNSISLDITNITTANPSVFTVPNHNLSLNSFIKISNTGVATNLDGNIYVVVPITRNTFSLLDSNLVPVISGAAVNRGNVTTIENFQIQSKKFTPFIESGQKVRVGYVDLFLESNTNEDEEEVDFPPDMTCYLYENENYTKPIVDKKVGLVDEIGSDDDFETTKFWNRVYLNQTAQSFSITLGYSTPYTNPGASPYQIFDTDNASSTVALHGMIFWMAPAGRLVR